MSRPIPKDVKAL